MVNVYNENNEIIADVDYNNKLDTWNGNNWQSGGTGQHKGLTRLENGKFVLIHGSDWQGVQDYGEIISRAEALQEILNSRDLDLLDEFDLREDYENKMLKEKDYSTKSIKVSRKVHEQLTKLASKNESYSDVIQKLIDSNNES